MSGKNTNGACLTHGTYLDGLKSILKSGKILPACSKNIGYANFLEGDIDDPISCGNYTTDEILTYLSKNENVHEINTSKDEPTPANLAYMSVIFDPKNINEMYYNYMFTFQILIDPEVLRRMSKKHIHMSLGWHYGKITKDTILYNKYLSPLENLSILEKMFKNEKGERKQINGDIEIVAREFNIKNYILGVIINTRYVNENTINEINELKKKYPNLVWFSSFKEFMEFF
jgi:hypothetical protein